MKAQGILILAALPFLSCAGQRERNDPAPAVSPRPPVPVLPSLRIADHRDRELGALPAWLRSYLEGGLSAAEALADYEGFYLFVAVVHSPSLRVVEQWLEQFDPRRDLSRLAAERIKTRLDRDAPVDPVQWYGPGYERTVKAAYRTGFWGGRLRDDTWVLARENGGAAGQYWGFILLVIPRDLLEIQINSLLQTISAAGGRDVSRGNFDTVRGHFFDGF